MNDAHGSARRPHGRRRTRARAPRRLDLELRTWGGRRPGAGRKPNGARAGVTHDPRPAVAAAHPVHVTLRVRRHVFNLRSRRCFRVIRAAFVAARERHGRRLLHYSVQGNHLHLVVEARGREALARGMQGLAIRLARGLNRVMARRGPVFADRYHAPVLRTPLEVRRALAYVLTNATRHGTWWRGRRGPVVDPYTSGAWFDGWRGGLPVGAAGHGASRPVSLAPSWLARAGWRRHGLIALPQPVT